LLVAATFLLFVAFCWSDVQLLVKAQVFLLLHFIGCLAYLQGDHLSGFQSKSGKCWEKILLWKIDQKFT